MKNLRYSFAGLLLGLVAFFFIDRLQLSQADAVRIQDFVYGLSLASVFILLLFPFFARKSVLYTLLLWIGVYAAFKLLPLNPRPAFGGIYTYLTLAEISLLSLVILLAYRVSRGLHEFNHAVEFITLSNLKTDMSQVMFDLIESEMNRSRHNNRSFSLILATIDPIDLKLALPRFIAEAQEKIVGSYVTTRLAEALRSELRRMDVVVEDHKNSRVLVLSPEVDEIGTEVLLERLTASVNQRFGVQLKCGAAACPNRALTLEDLLQEAESAMHQEDRYYQFADSSGAAD